MPAQINESRSTRGLLKKFGVRDRQGFNSLDDTIYPVASVEPKVDELATLDHRDNPSTLPCLGTSWKSFVVVNPAAGSTIVSQALTRGLYLFRWQLTTSVSFTGQQTLEIARAAGALASITWQIRVPATGACFPAGQQEATVWVPDVFDPVTGFPAARIIQNDVLAAGNVIGNLQTLRSWTDDEDRMP